MGQPVGAPRGTGTTAVPHTGSISEGVQASAAGERGICRWYELCAAAATLLLCHSCCCVLHHCLTVHCIVLLHGNGTAYDEFPNTTLSTLPDGTSCHCDYNLQPEAVSMCAPALSPIRPWLACALLAFCLPITYSTPWLLGGVCRCRRTRPHPRSTCDLSSTRLSLRKRAMQRRSHSLNHMQWLPLQVNYCLGDTCCHVPATFLWDVFWQGRAVSTANVCASHCERCFLVMLLLCRLRVHQEPTVLPERSG